MAYRQIVFLVVLGILSQIAPLNAQIVPSPVQPGREPGVFTLPPAPLSRAPGFLVQLPESMAPEAAAKIQLHLEAVTVDGSTVYKPAELEALAADLIGKDVSGAAIYGLANKISARYGQDGYLVARTVIVPQAVNSKHAKVRLRVVEGYIEDVEWPASASRYRDVFSTCIDKIKTERPARTRTIERCLLMASDLPGLTFASTLKAGKHKDGGIILVVTLTEKPFSGSAGIDNHGAAGRGPWEYNSSITASNLLGQHEALTLNYAGALPFKQLQYVGLAYHQVLTPDGLAFDASATYSRGWPGLPALTAINYNSVSTSFEAGFTYPVIRSREQNLRLSALGFVEDAAGNSLGAQSSDDRLRGGRVRANYDQVDTWFGTLGQSQIIATFSQGINGLGSTVNGNPLASVANGRVDFSKFEVTANRTQALGAGFSLFGAVDAQWSGGALLAAEQCVYGGMLFGRAFDADELAGDRCWSVLGESRYDLPVKLEGLSQAQLYSFIDHGDLYRVNPSASTPSHLYGSSAGAGLRIGWNNALSADLQAAKPLEGRSDQGWRFFLTVSAKY